MFSTEEKVKQIIEYCKDKKYSELEEEKYVMILSELLYICEDFMMFKQECENKGNYIESQANYIRLLEKENKELRGDK